MARRQFYTAIALYFGHVHVFRTDHAYIVPLVHTPANHNWTVHAFGLHGGAGVKFGYATKKMAKLTAEELPKKGYVDVEVIKNPPHYLRTTPTPGEKT